MTYNVEYSNYQNAKSPPSNEIKPPDKNHHPYPPSQQQLDHFPPLSPASPSALSYTSGMTQLNNGQRTPTPSPTPILTQVSLPSPTRPQKRQFEDLEDPDETPTRQRSYTCSSPRQIESIILGTSTASPYGPDEEMEEDTDWAEEERHFNRLNKVRDLLNELAIEFNAAQNEQCLNFLTEDPEIQNHLAKFSSLTPLDFNAYNNCIFTGIADIKKLVEQVSGKLDRLPNTPLAAPDKTITSSIHATPTHLPPTAPTSPPQRPLYNAAVKNAQAKPPQSTKTELKQPLNPKASHHPSRLVVQFKPNGIPPEQRPDPSLLVGNINASLAHDPQSKHLKVVAANFNNQGNLILSTRSDQTAEQLMKFQNSFSHLLANLNNQQEVILREDKKWFKVQVDGVSTGSLTPLNGRILHSAEDVHKELLACNPLYANSKEFIAAKPRWLRTEEELSTTPKSSLVFALTDEPTARLFLNQKSLAAFGRHCTLRAFQDRPPVTQCRTCWSLDHPTHRCTEIQRCRLCSALHDEKEHQPTDPANCQKCNTAKEYGDSMDTTAEGHCPHDLRCANCISNNHADNSHPADARRCPVRLAKYGTARDNERRAQKSSNPWIKVKPKKPKTKNPNLNDLPKPNTNPPSTNRFDAIAGPITQVLEVHAPTPIRHSEMNTNNTSIQQ